MSRDLARRDPVVAAVRATLAAATLAVTLAVTLAGALLLAALPAAAHTELLGVSPGPGETVAAGSQVTVSLTFTEAIDPAFATVVVVGAGDQVVAADPVRVDGADVTQPVLGTLAPGEYAIRYRVVSADGHPVDGESRFVVAAAPAPSPTDTAATEPGPSEPGPSEPGPSEPGPTDEAPSRASADPTGDASATQQGSSAVPLGLGAAAVAAVVGGGALAARRRTSGSGGVRDHG